MKTFSIDLKILLGLDLPNQYCRVVVKGTCSMFRVMSPPHLQSIQYYHTMAGEPTHTTPKEGNGIICPPLYTVV